MYAEDRKGQKQVFFHASKRDHKWISRSFSLLLNHDRLFILDKCTLIHGAKGCDNEMNAKMDADDRLLEQGYKVMYLSPNVFISREANSNVIKLRLLKWSDKQLRQKDSYLRELNTDKLPDLSWHKCGRLLSRDKCAKIVCITFDSVQEAEKWEKEIKKAQISPKLPSDFFHSHKLTDRATTLYKNLDCSIWRMILSGDNKASRGIRAFYFNLTSGSRETRSGDIEPITNGPYGAIFARLQDLSVKLRGIDKNASDNNRKMRGIDATTFSEDDEIDVEIFCYLLYRISMDKLDRILLLLSNFTGEYFQITDDEAPDWYSENQNETYWMNIRRDSLRVAHAFLNRSDDFMNGAEKFGHSTFMKIIEDSVYAILSVKNDLPDNFALQDQVDQPMTPEQWDSVAYWFRNEVEIFRNLTSTGSKTLLEITPIEIDLAMKSPMWLLHALMTQMFFHLLNLQVEYIENKYGRERTEKLYSSQLSTLDFVDDEDDLNNDEDNDDDFENTNDNEIENNNDNSQMSRQRSGSVRKSKQRLARAGTTVFYVEQDIPRNEIIEHKSRQIVDIYKKLPVDFLLLNFEAKLTPKSYQVTTSPHLINCLFLFPPAKQHEVFKHYIQNHSVSGELYRAFLKQSFLLTLHSTRVEESMMKHMLDITGWLLFEVRKIPNSISVTTSYYTLVVK